LLTRCQKRTAFKFHIVDGQVCTVLRAKKVSKIALISLFHIPCFIQPVITHGIVELFELNCVVAPAHSVDGDGVSARNVGKPSYPDAAVCPRKCK
jgi:hypothetical protein